MNRSLCIVLLAGLSLSCAQRQSSVQSEGFSAPEEAAITMFRATANQDSEMFIQSRLLGVCEGVND